MAQQSPDTDLEAHVLKFPEDFTWGAATSAFQIEGSPRADGKSPSIWDTFCATPGRISDASSGDVACDHYVRYLDDVSLLSALGMASYRFSIAWTRVKPGGVGPTNPKGLDFYDRLVDALLAEGITPMPTLYHWDLPQVLDDRGGWLDRSTAEAFADYAEAAVTRLGDRVGTWTTLNEPFVSANHGYVTGEHAPGHTSLAEGFAAGHHLLLAHGLAAERIRSLAPDARLAIVLNFTPQQAASSSDADLQAASLQSDLENRWYADPLNGLGYPTSGFDHYGWDGSQIGDGDLDLISAPLDLLGVNYYTRQLVSADPAYAQPGHTPRNTMGWEIHPESLGQLMRTLWDRYSFPSYMITENGAPMPDLNRSEGRVDDDDRTAYIRDHLTELHGAIQDGCPIEGYLVWSFMDNFEWAEGYVPRFGVVEVDYETQTRTPKQSALWFRDVARTNQVVLEPERLTYRGRP